MRRIVLRFCGTDNLWLRQEATTDRALHGPLWPIARTAFEQNPRRCLPRQIGALSAGC